MNHLNLHADGLERYEVPGIEGYLSLAVDTGDGLFQMDIRRMPEAASHTMPPEPARAASREEGALVISLMFIACLAGQGRVERRGAPVGKRG